MVAKELWRERPVIERRLRRARRLAVVVDFDGTVARIVSHPARAVILPGARRALSRLARLPGASVALISGRQIADLRRRAGVRGAFLAGLSGIETRAPGGRTRLHLRRDQRLPETLIADLARWCERFPGAWLEHKAWSVALHYRAVAPRQAGAFGAGVRGRVRFHRHRAEILGGKKVYEIRPAGSPGKAAALAAWLAERVGGRGGPSLVVFFGDDANDAPALALVGRRRGVAVTVGRLRPRAGYRLGGPADVARFLAWLEERWRARGPWRGPGPASGPPRSKA